MNATFTADINITSYLKANVTSNVIWGQTNYSNYGNPFYGSKVSVNGELDKQYNNYIENQQYTDIDLLQGLRSAQCKCTGWSRIL